MKYSENGFRYFYHKVCGFPLKYSLHKILEDAGRSDLACHNFLMTYCYIDPDEGVMFEVLAGAHKFDDQYLFENVKPSEHISFSVSMVEDDECLYYDDEITKKRFARKIKTLDKYEVSPDVEETRKMAFLDASRERYHPDIVKVHLLNGERHEVVRVHITGLLQHQIAGTLLDEPADDMGCHKGEQVGFSMSDTEDGEICVIDMTPARSYTSDELKDGSLLEEAIDTYLADLNMNNFAWVIQILRDSYIWVPFNREGTPVLQTKTMCYLPVFSSAGHMNANEDFKFLSSKRPFLDAAEMVLDGDGEINGIIVNGFTQRMPLDMGALRMIRDTESLLKE